MYRVRMPTPGERRALIFIAAIAALGVALRGWKEVRGPDVAAIAGDPDALARQIEAVDSAIASDAGRRRVRAVRSKRGAAAGAPAPGRPVEPPERPAMPPEYPPRARFPREWTDAGPAARAASTAPRTRTRRPAFDDRDAPADPRPARERLKTASAPPPAVRRSSAAAARPPVDLDTAPLDEIAAVPVIGPALARRIVADRIEHGPFGSITGLERVRGVSRSLARRFQPHVTFSLPPRAGSAPERERVARKERRP